MQRITQRTPQSRALSLMLALLMVFTLYVPSLAADRLTVGEGAITTLQVGDDNKLATLTQSEDNTYDLGQYQHGTTITLQMVRDSGAIGGQRKNVFSLQQANDFARGRPTVLGFTLISLL